MISSVCKFTFLKGEKVIDSDCIVNQFLLFEYVFIIIVVHFGARINIIEDNFDHILPKIILRYFSRQATIREMVFRAVNS